MSRQRIQRIRSHIDRVDEKIVRLLAQRGSLVEDVLKNKNTLKEIEDPERASEILESVCDQAKRLGLEPDIVESVYRTLLKVFTEHEKAGFAGRTTARNSPHAAARTTPVYVGSVPIGGPAFVIIAGPCSIESEDQFLKTALGVKKAGGSILRGGIYKLRTDPHSFQGLGDEALDFAKRVLKKVGLPLVTEVVDADQIRKLAPMVDMFQVGSRNMHNSHLLKELGKTRKPILLKRGFSARIEEWLHAAEYITESGNPNVVLCERGIRTFETATRNTLDLNAVAYVKAHTRFPVIVDPSHGTGQAALVPPMAKAAAASGADGLIIEVHPRPAQALSDGPQSLDFGQLSRLIRDLKRVLAALDRPLLRPR